MIRDERSRQSCSFFNFISDDVNVEDLHIVEFIGGLRRDNIFPSRNLRQCNLSLSRVYRRVIQNETAAHGTATSDLRKRHVQAGAWCFLGTRSATDTLPRARVSRVYDGNEMVHRLRFRERNRRLQRGTSERL